jgi:hypothetical protein
VVVERFAASSGEAQISQYLAPALFMVPQQLAIRSDSLVLTLLFGGSNGLAIPHKIDLACGEKDVEHGPSRALRFCPGLYASVRLQRYKPSGAYCGSAEILGESRSR